MEEYYCAFFGCGKKFTDQYDYSKLKQCPVNNVDRYSRIIVDLSNMKLFCLKCCEKQSKQICNSKSNKFLK